MATYDDPVFFEAYAQMDRSRYGLLAAGEWHQLQKLIPCVKGLTVLDIGCGYGWHCKYLIEQGAANAHGIDESQEMIKQAKLINSDKGISYQLCKAEAFPFPEETYDLVLSNLVLHYVEDLDAIYRKVYAALKPGGMFVFNIEHPSFTACPGQDWIYTDEKPAYWPIDDYFYPGERDTVFLGCKVKKYHHTLTQILNGLIHAGFLLEAVEEARPSEEMAAEMPDEMRRPMMLLVRAKKS